MSDDLVAGLCVFGLFEVLALVFLRLAARMGRGTLRRNAFVGIRTSMTMASDQAWVIGHRAAAGEVRWAAVALAVSGAACGLAGLLGAPSGVTGPIAVAGCAVVVVVLLKATAAAHRAIREHR